MHKCVFFYKFARPKPDAVSGFDLFNDFNDLCNRLIKAHFSYVLLFSLFFFVLCLIDDRAAAIAYNSAAAVVSGASTPSNKNRKICVCSADLNPC